MNNFYKLKMLWSYLEIVTPDPTYCNYRYLQCNKLTRSWVGFPALALLSNGTSSMMIQMPE